VALIFLDYDGVLADSFKVEEKYFVEACEKAGIIGIHNGEDLSRLCEGNFYRECEKIGIKREQIDKAFVLYEDILKDNHCKIEAFPEMIELVREISNRFPVYIITSNLSSVVEDMLKQCDVQGVRDILGANEESSKEKKFQRVKSIFPGEKTYFVCDTTGDIFEAKNSGIDVIIGVGWGWHTPEKLARANPNYVFERIEELHDFFNGLCG
jgi:phosphoglycolate phosphatase